MLFDNYSRRIYSTRDLNKTQQFLATAGLQGVSNVEDACDAITRLIGTDNEVSEDDFKKVLSNALTDDNDLQVIDKILDCLLDLKLITPE